MLIHKLSNRASLRGHPNAALYKGIGISSKCRQLRLLCGKGKCVLKGCSLCNHAGFTTCRTAPWLFTDQHCAQSRGPAPAPTPAALLLGTAAPNRHSTKNYLPIKDSASQRGTDFQLPNMPIMKFLKGEACTEASGSHPVWSCEWHALSSRASAEWAKPFPKAEGLLQLFSSLQDPLNPSASSSSWHSGVDKIRSRLSTAQQKGTVKWAWKRWKPSSVGRRRWGRGVPSWERGGTCEQSCRKGVLWQSSSAGARAHSTGWKWLGVGGWGWVVGKAPAVPWALCHGFFFFSLSPPPGLPIPAPKHRRTGWQEERAEKDLTV